MPDSDENRENRSRLYWLQFFYFKNWECDVGPVSLLLGHHILTYPATSLNLLTKACKRA